MKASSAKPSSGSSAKPSAKPIAKGAAKRALQTSPRVQADALDIDTPTPLLAGMSPAAFMRKHWQKKPLLIRQAVPGIESPISRQALFALAESDEVESRLIVHTEPGKAGKAAKAAKAATKAKPKAAAPGTGDWTLSHGPLNPRDLPPLSQAGWTLLVQGLDLHVPAAYELLQRFRFVPDARLDDVMISFATDGGGVGPHFDSYDVFLLQVHGQRRWRVGPLRDASLQPDVPLKILSQFEPEQEWVLEPGDMLYLPPRWAHDGIAQGECMTCSIGFRAPQEAELAREVLQRLLEAIEVTEQPRLYRDPAQEAVAAPGLIPAALQDFAMEAVAKALKDPASLRSALGEVLTEPKPRVWFQSGEPLPDGLGARLDPRTRMVYDEKRVFANGESWLAAGKDARQLRLLADRRELPAAEVARASPALRELLDQWAEDGWLHPAP